MPVFVSSNRFRLHRSPIREGAHMADVSSMSANTISTGAQPRAWRWALVAGVLVLSVSYAPSVHGLAATWKEDPNYSHGFLVVPIALFILWRRLSDSPWEPSHDAIAAPWWSWMFLAVILAVRAIAYEGNYLWVETATIVPAIACLTWTFGGWPLLLRTWPAIAFLVFMLPLPNAINTQISLPLQKIATAGSGILLQLTGFWVVQEGNVLHLSTPFGMRPLDVAQACNGLKMLMSLAATVTATIALFPLPVWKRIVLLVSAIPIAMVSNMIRIVGTAWCYYFIPGELAQEWAHDISGWLMMPLALLLVGLELVLLSWLVSGADEEGRTVIPLLSGKGTGNDPAAKSDLGELT
jgi:exosortase